MATRAVEQLLLFRPRAAPLSISFPTAVASFACRSSTTAKRKKKNKSDETCTSSVRETEYRQASTALLRLKRRTRSGLDLLDKSLYEEDEDFGQQRHLPVMLGEVLQVFRGTAIRSFVDCTLGAGGHSAALVRSHPETRVLIGLDVDPTALDLAKSRLNRELSNLSGTSSDLKVYTRLNNFRYIKSVLRSVCEECGALSCGVDGILMDLGMSSMQVDDPQRGFSILADGPLDMRMDPKASLTAENILNSWPEEEIGRILRVYGEERNWKMLQRKIVGARIGGGLRTTMQLANLVRSMPLRLQGRHGWLKTATRVFQALRIAVNDELQTLEDALRDCFDCLSPGGRLAVISFHSLEDRIVKHTFLDIVGKRDMDGESQGVYEVKEDVAASLEEWVKASIAGKKGLILTKRPITPSQGEEELNPRCRSAKLRVLQKL